MAVIKRVLIAGGGGWKGAYQRRILQRLWETNRYDAVLGTSVGALNLALTVQNKFAVMDEMWDSFDTKTPIFGVPGFLRPVWPKAFIPFVERPEGLFSLNPILPLLREHVDIRDFSCTYGVGVVDRDSGKHSNIMFRPVGLGGNPEDNKTLHKAIMATSVMNGIMEPIRAGRSFLVDGGHRHLVNPPEVEWRHLDEVDVVFCQALDEPVHVGKAQGILANLVWGIETAFHVAAIEDLEDYRELARAGVKVRVCYPKIPLGDMLDASAQTIRWRTAMGAEDFSQPIILK